MKKVKRKEALKEGLRPLYTGGYNYEFSVWGGPIWAYDTYTNKCFKSFFECWGDCIEKYDPVRALGRALFNSDVSNKIATWFGTITLIFGTPLNKVTFGINPGNTSPFTNLVSAIILKIAEYRFKTLGIQSGMRSIMSHTTRNIVVDSPMRIFVAYGSVMAAIELSCAVHCKWFQKKDGCKK